MKRFALLTLAAAALVGCSSAPRTPTYECPLDTLAEAKCASMERAHEAAVSADTRGQRRVQSVFDPRVQQGSEQQAQQAQPYFNGQLNPMPAPSQNGMPVFQQPKVMRVWIAPYVDADGNLRSGEYAYINTPGAWSYGGLKRPGAAAGAFGPSRPDNLGFTPNLEAPKAAAGNNAARLPALPTAPGNGSATSPNNAPSAPPEPSSPAATPARSPVEGITQPYQRLNAK